MTTFFYSQTQIAVIGAGHAGVEAALAAARLGMDTVLFTLSLDQIANMPCNPSIGGTGKGHLVYEIDALGGEMGRAADKVTLQSRTLNAGKGPAVRSRRVQADRRAYQGIMKQTIEKTKHLRLVQAEIVDILTEDRGGRKTVTGVVTSLGAIWKTNAVIICSGTYLDGRIVVGEGAYPGGPDGSLPAKGLSEALRRLDLPLMRFKTGTPPRIHRRSIDFSRLEIQEGDTPIRPYSVDTDEREMQKIAQLPCHITYTNAETHRIIRENLHRSPLYSGVIEGTGPRYCPSIEDKVVRFADKDRHQLFLEPMGRDTDEMYLQGFSSSLPLDVQIAMLHTLPGFENAEVMRPAYAIEYDCISPLALLPTLACKTVTGLFGAGQFNGTSGYEEAAAQGLIAGINAALWLKGEDGIVLSRDSSYIGTLIDDLVTKGTNEPYRIMTSRSEYRLLLRQDNADARLTPIGHRVGLISEERFAAFRAKQAQIESEITRLEKTIVPPTPAFNDYLASLSQPRAVTGFSLADLLRRPPVSYEALAPFDPDRPILPASVTECAEIAIKYEGYIKRQLKEAARMEKLEEKRIPDTIDYSTIDGLRLEARQKLAAVRPATIGQASRISGVSPADIGVLMVVLRS